MGRRAHHAVVVCKWDGAEGPTCSVYLPTHGVALAEFENCLEALESLLLAAPQVGLICAVCDCNTAGGS